MDEGGKSPLPHFFFKNPRRIGFGVTRVDYQRQSGFTCDGDVGAEQSLLHRAIGLVIIVVQPGFADGRDLFARRQLRDAPGGQHADAVALAQLDAGEVVRHRRRHELFLVPQQDAALVEVGLEDRDRLGIVRALPAQLQNIFQRQVGQVAAALFAVAHGVGHHFGYRSFEMPSAATYIIPWGLFIAGEDPLRAWYLEKFRTADVEDRGVAAMALGELGAVEAIPEIVATCQSLRRGEPRRDVMEGHMYPPDWGAGDLIHGDIGYQVSGEPSDTHRSTVFFCDPVVLALKLDERGAAFPALLRMVEVSGEAAVPFLRQALRSGDGNMKFVAALLLGRIGPAARDAIPELLRALEEPRWWVRQEAARALGAVDPAQTLRAGDRLRFAGVVDAIRDLQRLRGFAPASSAAWITCPRNRPSNSAASSVVKSSPYHQNQSDASAQ